MKQVTYMSAEDRVVLANSISNLYDLTRNISDSMNKFNESVKAFFVEVEKAEKIFGKQLIENE